MGTQVETLITRPLENACAAINPDTVKMEWPRLIVIDDLDEYNGSSVQSSIIRVLSNALRRIPVPLMLLITSRPEPQIRNTFNILAKSHASRRTVLDDSYEPDGVSP